MADTRAASNDPAAGRLRHADSERRRGHPDEPRRTTPIDRPSPRDDRRGAHAWAGTRKR